MRLTRSKRMAVGTHAVLAVVASLAVSVPAQSQGATITGRVTAAGTNEPLAEARVMVVNTSVVVPTNSEGRYVLRGVPTGSVEVRVLRVGYQEQKKAVSVSPGASVTLDFLMTQAIVRLQEIVTTATGEQRRVEIGNAVSTLGDVNQRVENTATTNLSDLMVAKSPGVVLLPGNMTSSAPTVRIRGLNSLSLSNAPIYVIDGVHMNSDAINGNVGGTNTSYLNDLNPAEIEDIEIVKGPSAATLYGTAAANGVIVITTKKGRAGATRWSYYAEEGQVRDRNKYPSSYADWGHCVGTACSAAELANPIRCNLVTVSAGLRANAACVVDSTTSANLFKDKTLSVLATGPRSQYGAQAAGGNDAMRFFVSGDIENELGPVKMPDVFISRFDSIHTSVRDEWIHPEAFQRSSFRTNMNATLSPKIDFSAQAGFVKSDQRLPQVDNNTFSYLYNSYQNPGFIPERIGESAALCAATPARCLGYPGLDGVTPTGPGGGLGPYELHGYGLYSPAELFQRVAEQGIHRFISSANTQWRPFAWMQNDGTVGIDVADRDNLVGNRFGEGPASGTTRQGTINDTRSSNRQFSAKITSNSSWQARQNLNFKTTVGSEYGSSEQEQTVGSSTNLPPGAFIVGAGSVKNSSDSLSTAVKTLGFYLQEQASFRDRMFLTVAARSDQNSAFGTDFQRVFYPKASLSWIMSDEPWFPHFDKLNQFRYRFAYGASGVQPGATTTFRTYASSVVNLATNNAISTAKDTSGLIANALGNPKLKPETSTEFETGFESRLFNNRLNLDLTYYSKKTKDALLAQPIAPSSGAPATPTFGGTPTVLTNIASVANSGFEAQVTTTVFDRRNFGWDMTISASHNSNKILKIPGGNGFCSTSVTTACDTVLSAAQRWQVRGRPINGLYYLPFTYSDKNSDGIITPDEVTVGRTTADGKRDTTTFDYMGYSAPRDLLSIQSGIDLFARKLHLTALIDYKGGFALFNSTTEFYCQQTNFCYDVNIGPGQSKVGAAATLDDQARNVAQRYVTGVKTQVGYVENGQFWRLREVSGSLKLPDVVSTRIRAKDASLVFAVRNLHVWTKYKGIDPESGYGNGDVQNDFSTTSPPTYLIFRLNLHY